MMGLGHHVHMHNAGISRDPYEGTAVPANVLRTQVLPLTMGLPFAAPASLLPLRCHDQILGQELCCGGLLSGCGVQEIMELSPFQEASLVRWVMPALPPRQAAIVCTSAIICSQAVRSHASAAGAAAACSQAHPAGLGGTPLTAALGTGMLAHRLAPVSADNPVLAASVCRPCAPADGVLCSAAGKLC